MDRAEIEPSIAYRLVNPGCVLLVSVGDAQRDNLFALTWNMPVRKDPGLVAIVCGKGNFSHRFIAGGGEFGLNVPDAALVDAVLGCGSVSGDEVPDKFGRFGLTREKARVIDAPLVAEAVASIECRVCQAHDLGGSTLFVAQIVAARAAEAHFRGGHWTFDGGLGLLHHLSGSRFCVSGRAIEGRAP